MQLKYQIYPDKYKFIELINKEKGIKNKYREKWKIKIELRDNNKYKINKSFGTNYGNKNQKSCN